jgi:hypothetical protein
MKNAHGESNWWLIEQDADKKTFTIIGPISDDTKFIEKVCFLVKQGRNVSISTVDAEKNSKVELIKEFRQILRYEYVEYDILEN